VEYCGPYSVSIRRNGIIGHKGMEVMEGSRRKQIDVLAGIARGAN
jgi:hypothetical protein